MLTQLKPIGLTVLALAINQIPCIGWLPWFLVACVGLGGVILTRFGTQAYEPLNAGPQITGRPTPGMSQDVIEVAVQDVDATQPEADDSADEETADDISGDSES